jgi:hypothetical protein
MTVLYSACLTKYLEFGARSVVALAFVTCMEIGKIAGGTPALRKA